MTLKGVPPHKDKLDSNAWQQWNSAVQKAIKSAESRLDTNETNITTLQTAIGLFAQTAIADAVQSTVSVTSPDGSTTTATITSGGYGWVSLDEMSAAIDAINSTKTLANEIKSDVNTLKTDLNAVVTNQNALIAALQAAGIIT